MKTNLSALLNAILPVEIKFYATIVNRTVSSFPDHRDNLGTLLYSYSNTIGKLLSFYYKANSNIPQPKVVANETIHALERGSIGSNAETILMITVEKDSKKYSELKRSYQIVNFMNG